MCIRDRYKDRAATVTASKASDMWAVGVIAYEVCLLLNYPSLIASKASDMWAVGVIAYEVCPPLLAYQ